MSSLKEKAEAIIEGYARGHAGTAFVAGHLGGQFGADRIPLTALTVAMIIELCDLYDITDSGARTVHIAEAIWRLTYRGTLVAQTILNWIPLIGPGANSVTTYFLTKQAGWDCVNDIEQGRMTLEEQAKKTAKSVTINTVYSTVSDISQVVSDDVVDSIVSHADQLNEHSETIATLLKDETLQNAEKRFLSNVLSGTSIQAISGSGIDIKEELRKGIFSTIASTIYDEKIQLDGNYVPNKEELLQRLMTSKEIYPEHFHRCIDSSIEQYSNALNKEEKEKAVKEMANLVKTGLELIKVK